MDKESKRIYDQQYFQRNKAHLRELARAYRKRKRLDVPCRQCGKIRHLVEGQYRYQAKQPYFTGLCKQCAIQLNRGGRRSHWWRGGRTKTNGYILIKLHPSDFFYPMVDHQGYILEHRLVMARHLSRCLHKWEVVHHKNGIRDDNRRENLELLPHGRFHLVDLHTKSYIRALERQIKGLKSEVAYLRGG